MTEIEKLNSKRKNSVFKYSDLNAEELQLFKKEKTLVIISISPMEVHGPHLPIGTDLIISDYFAENIGIDFKKIKPDWEVIIFPSIPIGADTLPLKGSINFSQRMVKNTVLYIGKSIANIGFKNIVLFNIHGGPRHMVGIEEGCSIISRKYKIKMFSPFDAMVKKIYSGEFNEIVRIIGNVAYEKSTEQKIDFDLKNDFHAGKWETSAMINIKPSLVDDFYKYLPEHNAVKFDKMEEIGQKANSLMRAFRIPEFKRNEIVSSWNLFWSLVAWIISPKEITYIGSPSYASKEYGEQLITIFKKFIVDFIVDVVDEKENIKDIHSPFWNLPFLRTNFFRYLLGFSIAGTTALWYFYSKRKKV